MADVSTKEIGRETIAFSSVFCLALRNTKEIGCETKAFYSAFC
jgi:hypothetical protein